MSRIQAPAAVETHSIPPFFGSDSQILILGSFPSVKSRESGFYYGHPQNRFWRVMEALFELPSHSLVENDMRRAFLLKQHIALWDVLASCTIEGSADASIVDAIPNDLTRIFDAAPITHVFTTGGKATQLCQRMNGDMLSARNIALTGLPSTSAANARMRLNQLVEAYRPIVHAVTAGNCHAK